MLHAEAKQQVTTSATLREQGERNKENSKHGNYQCEIQGGRDLLLQFGMRLGLSLVFPSGKANSQNYRGDRVEQGFDC